MEKAHLGALPISSYSKLNLLRMRARTKWPNQFHHTANRTYYTKQQIELTTHANRDKMTTDFIIQQIELAINASLDKMTHVLLQGKNKRSPSIGVSLSDVLLLPFFTRVIFQMSKTLGKVRTLFQVLLRLDFSDII